MSNFNAASVLDQLSELSATDALAAQRLIEMRLNALSAEVQTVKMGRSEDRAEILQRWKKLMSNMQMAGLAGGLRYLLSMLADPVTGCARTRRVSATLYLALNVDCAISPVSSGTGHDNVFELIDSDYMPVPSSTPQYTNLSINLGNASSSQVGTLSKETLEAVKVLTECGFNAEGIERALEQYPTLHSSIGSALGPIVMSTGQTGSLWTSICQFRELRAAAGFSHVPAQYFFSGLVVPAFPPGY